MPELPEVEVLRLHLVSRLRGFKIERVEIMRPKLARPTTPDALRNALEGTTVRDLTRRAKYLLLVTKGKPGATAMVHLGMTGRLFLIPKGTALPKHARVVLHGKKENLVFEDPRMFGRFTLDLTSLEKLGPEPLDPKLTPAVLKQQLSGTRQAIKIALLDQTRIVGLGNIYASEALFRAGIDPRKATHKLTAAQIERLCEAIHFTLANAIRFGSSLKLAFDNPGSKDALFYYGLSDQTNAVVHEKFFVYDRAGEPCRKCGTPIKRLVQAARSTFYCPACQRKT
jgi:formamidopyrimidine-DNA glycosylase